MTKRTTTKAKPTYRRWECPKCGVHYVNPIPALEVRHKCKLGRRVKLKPVKERGDDE